MPTCEKKILAKKPFRLHLSVLKDGEWMDGNVS